MQTTSKSNLFLGSYDDQRLNSSEFKIEDDKLLINYRTTIQSRHKRIKSIPKVRGSGQPTNTKLQEHFNNFRLGNAKNER